MGLLTCGWQFRKWWIMGGCVLQELLAFTLYLFVVEQASQQKQVNGFLLDNKTENTYGI